MYVNHHYSDVVGKICWHLITNPVRDLRLTLPGIGQDEKNIYSNDDDDDDDDNGDLYSALTKVSTTRLTIAMDN